MLKHFSVAVVSLFSLVSISVADVVAPMMAAQLPPPSPVLGLGSQVEPGLGITVNTYYSHRTKLRQGTTDVANPAGQENTYSQTTVMLDYNLTNSLSLFLSIPYVYKRAQEVDGNMSVLGNQPFSEKTSGLGDIGLLTKFALYKDQLFNARQELQAIVGIEVPTGSKGQGESVTGTAAASNQAGSGTTNFIIGMASVWAFSPFSLYGDVTHKFHADNASYRYGDATTVRAGMNLPFPSHPKVSLINELSLRVAARDHSDVASGMTGFLLPDGKVDSSGGETVTWGTGFQWQTPWKFSIQPLVYIPLHQNLKGTQLRSGTNVSVSIHSRFGGVSK